MSQSQVTDSENIDSVTVRIAEQGFIGRVSFKSVTGMGGCSNWVPDEEYALADMPAVIKFLGDHLGAAEQEPVDNSAMNTKIRGAMGM